MNLRHNYQSRHISRTFIYLLIFILLFLFLLWWNSIPENVETPIPRHGHKKEKIVVIEDKIGTKSSRENIKSFKQIENPIPLMPVEIPPKKKANIVHLTIYMEAQCPDTTGFIRRQLLPSWSRLGSTKRLNITLVPFGKASCVEEADDYKCDCQHGKDECELNQLMNCAIEHLPDPDTHIPLIGCVQGKDNLISAFRSCLNGHTSSDLLWTCSIGKHGRRLHALAGNKTYSIGDSFNFVPWVVLNGQRENDAFYALEENLCKRIDEPIPKQCLKFL